jgi:hypothetical protein
MNVAHTLRCVDCPYSRMKNSRVVLIHFQQHMIPKGLLCNMLNIYCNVMLFYASRLDLLPAYNLKIQILRHSKKLVNGKLETVKHLSFYFFRFIKGQSHEILVSFFDLFGHL